MVVTVTDVKNLMVMPSAETADFSLHLATAQLIVDEGPALSTNPVLSADRLDKITLFLAAHFVAVGLEKGGITRKDQGEAKEYYRAVAATKEGYMSTVYGQQALALDTTGLLIAEGTPTLKAEFRVV